MIFTWALLGASMNEEPLCPEAIVPLRGSAMLHMNQGKIWFQII